MTWDVDGNGQFDALTDGKLILGYLFGLTGEALIRNSIAPDATRTRSAEIIVYLESIRDQLDVDGNGIIDALTDAILYLRYLFGFTGEALTRGAVGADARRDGAEQIVAYLESIDNQTTDPNPENDNFANAQEISGVPITSTGQNVDGTKEVDEPNHAGSAGGSSVWWSWTAPENGSFRITTAGSDFDTLLGVYTGNSLSSLTEIASNDDSEDSEELTSSVTFSAVAGTNYKIAVDGFDGEIGNITLNIEDVVNALNNDNFANAQEISGADLTSTGQNVDATKELGEPNHAENAGGSSVWWSWTASENGSVTIATAGSDFDTVLGVYAGNSLSSLTEIASNDDSEGTSSRVTFSAVAGTDYKIAVDGFDGDAGNIILSIDSASTVSLSSSKLSSSKTIDLPDLLIGTSASDMLVGRSKENIPMDASDGFMGISNSLTTEAIGSVEISDPSNSLTVPIAAGNAVNANLPDLTTNSDDGFTTVMSIIVDDNLNQNFPIS